MNRLRELRCQRGLAMWAVAAQSRVNPSLLSGIERYDYQPSAPVRERIAVALGVAVTDIWPKEVREPEARLDAVGRGGNVDPNA